MPDRRVSAWSVHKTHARDALYFLVLFCTPPASLYPQDVHATTAPGRAELSALVVDAAGKPVAGASVTLLPQDGSPSRTGETDSDGRLALQPSPGTYTLRTQKDDLRCEQLLVLASGARQQIRFVLSRAAPASASVSGTLGDLTPELSDKPNFSVAGVQDWTAVGGHGSDAVLRTSESLTRDAAALKTSAGPDMQVALPAGNATLAQLQAALSAAPQHYDPNHNLGLYYLQHRRYSEALAPLQTAAALTHQAPEDEYNLALASQGLHDLPHARAHLQTALNRHDEARFHRLASQLAEQARDPLTAVKEQELATHMEPSEENYFELGSELLLHRAIWQASQTFASGTQAYPASARMRTAWGAALFAGARYDESARQLCAASDLDPASVQPYEFIGQIAAVSAAPEPCMQQKLKRFLTLKPEDPSAPFYLAMLLLKQGAPTDQPLIKILLERAVALRPEYAEAHLQLGILAFAQRNYTQAIEQYTAAIAGNSHLAEAHYRLAVAYDRVGQPELAREQFRLHDQLDREQAEAVEQQRREIKQFVIASQSQTSQTVHP